MNKNKIVVRIQWWLWNQMFQYAYAYALSKRNWCKFLLDVSTFDWYKVRKNHLSEFRIIPKYANKGDLPFYERYSFFYNWNFIPRIIKALCRRLNPKDYREKSKWYDEGFKNISNGYIIWYFQSEKYFKWYEDEICRLFSFSDRTESIVEDFIKKHDIILNDFVAISVRRGDFWTETGHYLIPLEWYLWAYQQFFSDKKLILFSDDIQRCKDNFEKLNHKYSKILYVEGFNAVDWLCLMSKFKNFIISNSTFSWWWAYLSSYYDKIVVRPDLEFDKKIKWEDYCRDHYPEKRIPFKW